MTTTHNPSDARSDGLATNEAVTVMDVTVPHNTVKWRVAKNRHPTFSGADWGWIEGAPGQVCWANDERFNRDAAGRVVQLHNDWLEAQKPLSIRRIEARERWAQAKAEYDRARAVFDKATDKINECDREILSLDAEEQAA